jgi:hypothetical protein
MLTSGKLLCVRLEKREANVPIGLLILVLLVPLSGCATAIVTGVVVGTAVTATKLAVKGTVGATKLVYKGTNAVHQSLKNEEGDEDEETSTR